MNQPARCPVHAARLLDPAFIADPYPALAAYRQNTPVFYDDELDLWIVTRHDDVRAILSDPETYSSANVQRPVAPICPAATEVLREEGFNPGTALVATDAPAHSARRRFLVKALTFTPKRLALLEDNISGTAHRLIDNFAARGSADLVSELTTRLPAQIIYDIIGFPREDHEQLLDWCLDRLQMSWGKVSEDEQVVGAHGMAAYWNYTKAFVAGSLESPQDNATGDLVRMHLDNPEALKVADIEDFLFGLIFAGQESTANLIAGTILALLKSPTLWQDTVADQETLPRVIEEGVRFISPINAWRRITTQPASLGGVDLPAGAQILFHIGSANHDEAFLADADRFDPDRPAGVKHLAFGFGSHFCIGAPLARLEARLTLQALMHRLPQLALAPDFREAYIPNVAFRVHKSLDVVWDPATARPRP